MSEPIMPWESKTTLRRSSYTRAFFGTIRKMPLLVITWVSRME